MNQGNREYTWSRDTGSKHMRYIGSTQIIDTWSIQSIDTGSKKNRDKRSTGSIVTQRVHKIGI